MGAFVEHVTGPIMTQAIYLLYLDRYHLDDTLFLQALARMLVRGAQSGLSFVLVHGAGDLAERRLEGEGYDVRRVDGVLDVRSTHEVEIVERAVRESNQRVTSVLTDGAVHAVGVQGIDRGLMQLRADGQVYAPTAGWVADLAGKRVVPVISALVRDLSSIVRQADPAEVAASLAEAFGRDRTTVVFFSKGGQAVGQDREVSVTDLPGEEVLPEPGAVRRVVERGAQVKISSLNGFLAENGVMGTLVIA